MKFFLIQNIDENINSNSMRRKTKGENVAPLLKTLIKNDLAVITELGNDFLKCDLNEYISK